MRWRPRLTRNEAVYRLLLRVYPASIRRSHEAEMIAWFREHFRGTAGRGGVTAWIGFWYGILRDIASTVLAHHLQARHDNRKGREQARSDGMLDGLSRDLRVALRSFARQPTFSIIAVGTLAIGIGAVTSVYTVAYGVLLAPLEYDTPDQIVRVGKLSEARDRVFSLSGPDLVDLQERNQAFSALAATRNISLTILGDGEPALIRGAIVSAEFFQVLGRTPIIGRVWDRTDDQPGRPPVAVVSHGIWQRRWGGDPAVLGRAVTLSGIPTTVVGILPPDFIGPEALGQRDTEVWLPLSFLDPRARADRRNGFLQVLGRLRPDVSFEAARAELATLGEAFSQEFPGPGDRVFGLFSLHAETIGRARTAIMPFLAAVGILLAIACVNVANLLLIRSSERQAELALRRAIGAGRGRIVRQLLTEGLVLGLVGGVAGVFLAGVGVRAIVAADPDVFPRISELSVDGHVMLFAVLITSITTIVFSLLPRVFGAGSDLADGLRRGGRGSGSTVSVTRVGSVLVVIETSLSFALVVAAGLLINSFARLGQVELGFEPDAVSVVTVSYPSNDAQEIIGFYDDVLARLAGLPGVSAVGATVNLPLSGNRQQRRIEVVEGRILDTEGYSVNYQQVTAGYFIAMGVRLLEGRAFDRRDGPGAPPAMVINESLAGDLFGERSPIGQRVSFLDSAPHDLPYEVVGVVADSRQQRLDSPGEPELYLSFQQSPRSRMDVVARTTVADPNLIAAMREQIWAVRPDLPIRRAAQLSDVVSQSMASPRFFMILLSTFAIIALTLALVGIYGTLAYVVSIRTKELGVRMALGASRRSVLGLVLGRGLRLIMTGVAIGVGVALLTTRLLSSFVFGITPTDPATMFAGFMTVMAAGVLACVIPARHAARLDPVSSLRHE